MTHPNLDLPKLTAQLESIGFEARTRLLFRRGFADIVIVNGILPDQIPEDLADKFDPFFRITISDESGYTQGSFNCPIEGFNILEFG